MDDAELRGAALEAPALGLYARDVLLDAADGDGQQSGSARVDLQNDQCRDATHVFLRLSALGYGFAEHDLRSAVPVGAGKAQHFGWEREARLQPRSRHVGNED